MKANKLRELHPEYFDTIYKQTLHDLNDIAELKADSKERIAFNAAFNATFEFNKAIKQKITDFQNFLILDGFNIDSNEAERNINVFTTKRVKETA